MLSSDAGISSMPSSMISNVSESDQHLHQHNTHQSNFAITDKINRMATVSSRRPAAEGLTELELEEEEPVISACPDVVDAGQDLIEAKVNSVTKDDLSHDIIIP